MTSQYDDEYLEEIESNIFAYGNTSVFTIFTI